MPKKVNIILAKIFYSFYNLLEVFWSSNIHDVWKFVFWRASVSLNIFLVFMCCLRSKNSRGDPNNLIYMFKIKNFWYNSPRRTHWLDNEAAQGTVKIQYVEDVMHHAPGTQCYCLSRAPHEVHYLKNYASQN